MAAGALEMTRLRRGASILLLGMPAALACAEAPAARPGAEIDDGFVATLAAEQPDSSRERIVRAMRLASAASADSARDAHVETAAALARAYAEAWSDSFFVRRVARFDRASNAERRAIAMADSLRDAGRLAAGREGISAAMRLWRQSLRWASAAQDSAAHAGALYSIGAGFYLAGGLDSAKSYLDDALRVARAIGDNRTIGNALGTLASVSKDRGELKDAAALYERALAIRPRSGDTRGTAADRNNLGLIALALGDLDAARDAFERALALNREHGRDRATALNLTNLGDIASIRGDYAEAQQHYEQALELNRAAGDIAETAFVLHDLGLLAMRRGAYREALVALEQALSVHERSGATLDAVAVRGDLAAVQSAAGDLEPAVAMLRRAGADAAAAGAAPDLQGRVELARADLAAQLGLNAEADAAYRHAERLFRQGGDAAAEAQAQHGRAVLLMQREDWEESLRLLHVAAQTLALAGDPRAAAMTDLAVADVRREMGDTAAARAVLSSAHEMFVRLGDVVGEAAALSVLGDLASTRGTPVAAESFYRAGLERLGERRVPDVRWRLHAGLAGALSERRALDAAAAELGSAIAAIEDVAAGLRVHDRRAGFLADKWQVYGTLAGLEQRRGRDAAGFAVSERMRARQLLALLDHGRISKGDESSDREQDLRRRITELTREIEADLPQFGGLREPALGVRALGAAREALDAAQTEYAGLLMDMRAADPAYARLVSAEPVDWRAVAARLTPRGALLEYLLTDSTATVFVVTTDTVAALDLGVGRRQVADLVDFARYAIDRPDRPGASSLWRSPLARLHDLLIEPVERSGLLEEKKMLVVVPHAELHSLPFGALLARDPEAGFLAERFEIGYAPSASVWLRLGERAASPREARALALAPHVARLPGSAGEVRAIQATLGRDRTTVLTGAAATEQALRSAAPRHGILHLATYGVLNKHNPLFSYIELAPARDDGRLEVHEVFDLELNGQLIVLSACQTAVGSGALADVPPGDDWIGLMHAFLEAGAASVLASLWPVDDRATARLMQMFYRELATGVSDATALARAQRALLRESDTAHPFYWAGFVLNGTSSK